MDVLWVLGRLGALDCTICFRSTLVVLHYGGSLSSCRISLLVGATPMFRGLRRGYVGDIFCRFLRGPRQPLLAAAPSEKTNR